MNEYKSYSYPERIICLTEESVETLYLLKKEHLIKGVSAFVKRPDEAQKLPKVSFFTSSQYNKISAQNPDLIIGHSDIQKDIARDLIELGYNVHIANHRSIQGILNYIRMLSQLVDAKNEGEELVDKLILKLNQTQKLTENLQRKPRIYFEEWDEPMISAIEWVSELIEVCGGVDINKKNSKGILAKDRFTTHSKVIASNPDIIIGCHCGKKVNINKIKDRGGYSDINAIKNGKIYEVAPEIFLQPGPAPILAGIDILLDIFKEWQED